MPESLSLAEARAVIIHAQGLAETPSAASRKAGPLEVVDQLTLLQLDSVNVFERAHYMPVFSRIGGYDKQILDDASKPLTETGRQAHLIEYWAHEAAWIKTEDLPLHRFRMDWYRFGTDDRRYSNRAWKAVQEEHGALLQWIREELRDKGPLTISEIEHDQNKRKGNWWGWSDAKTVLERMFLVGEVVSAGRDKFSRRYALAEQVLDAATYARMVDPNPDYEANLRTLIGRASKADGVATIKDLADFVRLKIDRVEPRVRELVELGELMPVAVADQKEEFFIHKDWKKAVVSGGLSPAKRVTLLSPFDPITRNRERASRFFDFDYKIEIYTPEPKRVFGYYTLPLLHKGDLVGRIDLKSDRKAGTLLVQSAWHEEKLSSKRVATVANDLAKHLTEITQWQELSEVTIADKGNLASLLRSASQSRANA